jgi:hypothetical protein
VVARQQRKSDADRLDRQLKADGDRLERQLENDRQLRDLAHLRAALGSVVTRTLSVEPVTELIDAVEREKSSDGAGQNQASKGGLTEKRQALWRLSAELGRDLLALAVIVPGNGPLLRALTEVRAAIKEAGTAVREWKDGGLTDDEVDSVLKAADEKHSEAVARFLVTAYGQVGAKLDTANLDILAPIK